MTDGIDTTPRVTSNGDAFQTLFDQRREAQTALSAALKALEDMAPNGRNYIGQPEAFAAAQAEWQGWVKGIKAARDSIVGQRIALHRRNGR